MIQPGWVIAAGVLFGLVHLFVYRYLRHGDGPGLLTDGSGEGAVVTPDPGRPGSGEPDVEADVDVSPDEGEWCGNCGALNDPTYTFCRRCASRLGTTTP